MHLFAGLLLQACATCPAFAERAPARTDCERLTDGLSWPVDAGNAQIARHANRYQQDGQLLRLWLLASPWLAFVLDEIDARGLPVELALLPVVESAYRNRARSPKRAAGVWQLMPATAVRLGLTVNRSVDERYDVLRSTEAALDHLGRLAARFDGNWLAAVAAYNRGQNGLARDLGDLTAGDVTLEALAARVPAETVNHLYKLLALATLVSTESLAPCRHQPGFVTHHTPHAVYLPALPLEGNRLKERLLTMNAQYAYGFVPAGRHVLLPQSLAGPAMETALGQTWATWHVQAGDTLWGIARQYGVSVAVVQSANNLRGDYIRAGQRLFVPRDVP